MKPLSRRRALRLLGGVPVAIGLGLDSKETAGATQHATRAVAAAAHGTPYKPRFFTAHEWKTVRVLADYVIPKDERSGAATDAGVPEFIDFLMDDPEQTERGREERQVPMRGGLAWLDNESRRRSGKDFVDAAPEQQVALLDAIAYTKSTGPGAAFFASFRDLVASGFWTSKMGMADIGYLGNTAAATWGDPPAAVLRKLGLED